MPHDDLREPRRRALKLLGAGTLAALPAGAGLEVFAALRRITTRESARKRMGENWRRVLQQAKTG